MMGEGSIVTVTHRGQDVQGVITEAVGGPKRRKLYVRLVRPVVGHGNVQLAGMTIRMDPDGRYGEIELTGDRVVVAPFSTSKEVAKPEAEPPGLGEQPDI